MSENISDKLIPVYETYPNCDAGIRKVMCRQVWQHGYQADLGWSVMTHHNPGPDTFHTDPQAALAQAQKHREDRVAKTKAELERLMALPPITLESVN